jgi:hypothetical protein
MSGGHGCMLWGRGEFMFVLVILCGILWIDANGISVGCVESERVLHSWHISAIRSRSGELRDSYPGWTGQRGCGAIAVCRTHGLLGAAEGGSGKWRMGCHLWYVSFLPEWSITTTHIPEGDRLIR